MRFQDDIPDEINYEQVFGGQLLNSRVIRPEDKPISYKCDGKTYVLEPTHPMYNVIKWYGEYEEDV